MKHPVSTSARAERRAAPKPARASRETRLAFVPSESAPADSEPRHSVPPGERGPRLQADLRRLGRPERLSRPATGRPTYPFGEGLT